MLSYSYKKNAIKKYCKLLDLKDVLIKQLVHKSSDFTLPNNLTTKGRDDYPLHNTQILSGQHHPSSYNFTLVALLLPSMQSVQKRLKKSYSLLL